MHRIPSQSEQQLADFCLNFENICQNISDECDFNAKCMDWWSGGINNKYGLELKRISSTYGYTQMINDEPTNFEPSKTPSCIDLIFSTNPDIMLDRGVFPTLCSTCHHQMIYCKVNL